MNLFRPVWGYHPEMTARKGFTLLEVVISITLMSVLFIILFRSITAIQKTDLKIKEKRRGEKNVYLFYNYLDQIIKSQSEIPVTLNTICAPFFIGTKDEITLISRRPLIYPYAIPHFIHFKFTEKEVQYQEKMYMSSGRENSSPEFSDEDNQPETILSDISDIKLYYQVWDNTTQKPVWKDDINSTERDSMPRMVHVEFTRGGTVYQLQFRTRINDRN